MNLAAKSKSVDFSSAAFEMRFKIVLNKKSIMEMCFSWLMDNIILSWNLVTCSV